MIKRFDLDKDNRISISEFEKFCLSIPHVSWKAEKMSREGVRVAIRLRAGTWPLAGRPKEFTKREVLSHPPRSYSPCNCAGWQIPRPSSDRGSGDRSARGSRSGPKEADLALAPALHEHISPPPVESHQFHFIHEGSKLMWRIRETLIAKIYAYDGPGATLAVVLHNETTATVSGHRQRSLSPSARANLPGDQALPWRSSGHLRSVWVRYADGRTVPLPYSSVAELAYHVHRDQQGPRKRRGGEPAGGRHRGEDEALGQAGGRVATSCP